MYKLNSNFQMHYLLIFMSYRFMHLWHWVNSLIAFIDLLRTVKECNVSHHISPYHWWASHIRQLHIRIRNHCNVFLVNIHWNQFYLLSMLYIPEKLVLEYILLWRSIARQEIDLFCKRSVILVEEREWGSSTESLPQKKPHLLVKLAWKKGNLHRSVHPQWHQENGKLLESSQLFQAVR